MCGVENFHFWKTEIKYVFIFLTYNIGTVHIPEQEANVLHMHRTEMSMFTSIETHVHLCVT